VTTIKWKDYMDSAQEAGAVPAGTYNVKVRKAQYKKSQNDKDMIFVVFEVQNGPKVGATIPNNFVLSPENPRAMGFFFQHMAVLGADAAFFAKEPSVEQVCEQITGGLATIDVSTREWNNTKRNNVDKVREYAGSKTQAEPIRGVPTLPPPQTPAENSPFVPAAVVGGNSSGGSSNPPF
jgi:hypothetical protein